MPRKTAEKIARVVTITVTDTDVANGKVTVNMAFDPPVKADADSCTPAVELAVAMFKVAKCQQVDPEAG